MRYGKNILILTLLTGLFLFFYIRYVNKERAAGIQVLFNQPEAGDVYKIRYTDGNGSRTVRYFKVAEVTDESVSFYRGKLSGWNVSDIFLDEYDRDWKISLSPQDLQKIKEGKFNNNDMKDAILIEIERKGDRIPANSL